MASKKRSFLIHKSFIVLASFFCSAVIVDAYINEPAELSHMDKVLLKQIAPIDGGRNISVIVVFKEGVEDTSDIEDVVHVRRRFSLINAVSGETTLTGLQDLYRNPKVEEVYFDEYFPVPELGEGTVLYEHKPMAHTSTIGALYVHNMLNYTGRNVSVAVVDTGIDYTHPDLGGCFGSGCKVVDGYDFVNNDSDPMDDSGHGTHCAGIIAAKGFVNGVAPDARLLAVKACSPETCSTSGIIAGIDWAVAHGADVVSLSIGSSVQPNDGGGVIERVCYAASRAGVVVVAAAGNEGPGSGTIADIASSRGVISVGAVNDMNSMNPGDDVVADWSCRGPVAFGRFGPDVLAPGVDILSTGLDSGYVGMYGTSMAAPHVAGAAALLKEMNRSMKPEEVKRLLVHNARNISASSFAQGTGVVNVSKAFTSKIKATVDGSDGWICSITPGINASTVVEVINLDIEAKKIALSLESLTDSEGDHFIDTSCIKLPSEVYVNPNESKKITISFICSSNLPPGTYQSILSINSGQESLRIPIALTIPLYGNGVITGSVNDYCTGGSPSTCGADPTGSVSRWGDWRFYKIVNVNGTSICVKLSWSNSINDLDLYIYNPNGVLAGVSGKASTSQEEVCINSPAYREYWAAVYAYYLAQTPLTYNLTINYNSSININPNTIQLSAVKGDIPTLNYTLKNDGTTDQYISLQVKTLTGIASTSLRDRIQKTGQDVYYVVWRKSTSGLVLDDAVYMNATLTWSDCGKDLDLYFVYKSGSFWNATRFKSKHRNDLLGSCVEKLEDVDIRYYLKNFPDIGLGISNTGSAEYYNLSIDFTGEEVWSDAIIVPEYITTLQPYGEVNVSVNLNTSPLESGTSYIMYLVAEENSQETARALINLNILEENVDEKTCTLRGDNPPCNIIDIYEILNLIADWCSNRADIIEVLALIEIWASQ